ncbi:hypothetical protein WDW89_09175 [Deltaproteobacteria bacterium TL4]
MKYRKHTNGGTRRGYAFAIIIISLMSMAILAYIIFPLKHKISQVEDEQSRVDDFNLIRESLLRYYKDVGEFPPKSINGKRVQLAGLLENPYARNDAHYALWNGPYISGIEIPRFRSIWLKRDYIYILGPTLNGEKATNQVVLVLDRGKNRILDSLRKNKNPTDPVYDADNWLSLDSINDYYTLVKADAASLQYDTVKIQNNIEYMMDIACFTGVTRDVMDWAEKVGWGINVAAPSGSQLNTADIRKWIPEAGPGGAASVLLNTGLLGKFNVMDSNKQFIRWAVLPKTGGFFYAVGVDREDQTCLGNKQECQLPGDYNYFESYDPVSNSWAIIGDDIPTKPVVEFRAFLRWPVLEVGDIACTNYEIRGKCTNADVDMSLKYIPAKGVDLKESLLYWESQDKKGSGRGRVNPTDNPEYFDSQGHLHPNILMGDVPVFLDVDTIPRDWGVKDPMNPTKWIEDLYFVGTPPFGTYIVGVNTYQKYLDQEPIQMELEVYQGFCKSGLINKDTLAPNQKPFGTYFVEGYPNKTDPRVHKAEVFSPPVTEWQFDPPLAKIIIGPGGGAIQDVLLATGTNIAPGSKCSTKGYYSAGFWQTGRHGAGEVATPLRTWSAYDSKQPLKTSNYQWVSLCVRETNVSDYFKQVSDVRIEIRKADCIANDCDSQSQILNNGYLGCSSLNYEHRGFWDASAEVNAKSGGIHNYDNSRRTTFFANLCIKRDKIEKTQPRVQQIFLDNKNSDCVNSNYRGSWDVGSPSTGIPSDKPEETSSNRDPMRLCVKSGVSL